MAMMASGTVRIMAAYLMLKENDRMASKIFRALAFFVLVSAQTCFADAVKGDVAPDAVGFGRDGARVRVSDYAGKVVVLSFWASWCGPCRKELPILDKLQSAADGKHVGPQVIAVNIEERDAFRKIAGKLDGIKLLLANDRGEHGAKSYGVKAIPHMVIIGKDGRIVAVHRGYGDGMIDSFLDEINKVLAAS
jgi:thiol-disulfide isomerase/thioredoxin